MVFHGTESWPGAQNEEKDATVREGSQPKGRSSGGRSGQCLASHWESAVLTGRQPVNFVSPLGPSFHDIASLVSPGPMSGCLLNSTFSCHQHLYSSGVPKSPYF